LLHLVIYRLYRALAREELQWGQDYAFISLVNFNTYKVLPSKGNASVHDFTWNPVSSDFVVVTTLCRGHDIHVSLLLLNCDLFNY